MFLWMSESVSFVNVFYSQPSENGVLRGVSLPSPRDALWMRVSRLGRWLSGRGMGGTSWAASSLRQRHFEERSSS